MWVNPNPNFRKHNYNAAVEIKLHAWLKMQKVCSPKFEMEWNKNNIFNAFIS